jgi:hypothetical protein
MANSKHSFPKTGVEARSRERYSTNFPCFFEIQGSTGGGWGSDLAGKGARLQVSEDQRPFDTGLETQVTIERLGRFDAILRWIAPGQAGVEFQLDSAEQSVLQEQLVEFMSDEL